MKCEHCGYENSEYAIRCDKCGKPLSIEKNLVLQKKYNHKPKAIDIVKITPDYELIRFKSTKQKVKYFLSFLLGAMFVSIILLCVYFAKNNKSKNIIDRINIVFDSKEEAIIYIGKNKDTNKLIKDYSEKYEFSYLYVPVKNITLSKKNKIKRMFDVKSLNDKIIYVKDGKVKNYKNIKTNDDIKKYLQKNGFISTIDGDTNKIKKLIDDTFNSQDPIVMYIANNENKSNEEHNEQLKDFCKDYDLKYVFIEGYKLSDNQKIRLLKRINYNEIHDELLVILDEGNIKNVSEFVAGSDKEYFALISSYGIIDESSEKKLVNISLKQLGSISKKNEISVILISSNDCQYCDKTKPILGKISIQNDFKIYNYKYNVKEKKTIEKYLTKRGFKEKTITTPLVIIFKDNKIEDYIIGMSSKIFYEEKFKDYGLIR